jgi:hypothetical protein
LRPKTAPSPSAADVDLDERAKSLHLVHEQACDEVDSHYVEWVRANGSAVFLPYAWQQEYLDADDDIVLAWTAAQMGKTRVLLQDLRLYFEGAHPRQRHKPPIIDVLVGTQWNQMIDTLRTLWETVDPRWFRAGLDLSEGSVRGQRNSILTAVSGPGRGGQIRLFTDEQGPTAIQGQRPHRAHADEPPSLPVYGELRSRVVSQHGCVRLGFTPRIRTVGESGGKLDWLWTMVDTGAIRCIHAPMTPANVTPASGLIRIPRFSQAYLDAYEVGLPAPEREMVMGRSRKPVFAGRVFRAWDRRLAVRLAVPGGARLGVGMDHGSKPHKQRVILAWATGQHATARVHVVREWANPGRTDEREIAGAILGMLSSIGHSVGDVDYWVGDRAHGGDSRGGKVANWRIVREIARLLGIDDTRRDWKAALPSTLRRIWVPAKYDGSVWDGCEVVGSMMARGAWTVDPDCVRLIDDIEGWQGSSVDDRKDGIDAARYLTVGIQSDDVVRTAA